MVLPSVLVVGGAGYVGGHACNRRNALKSTGPNTVEGKQQSRRNAVRHGLTAETVIGALEDAEDYKAFEAAIIADYDAQSAVERELVLRLAVTADKAYNSEKVRQQIKDEGALPIIPSRSNASKKAYCPKRFYRRRHKIENYFCRIKDWRRIATRYDKLARNFLAAATLIGALYWIKL